MKLDIELKAYFIHGRENNFTRVSYIFNLQEYIYSIYRICPKQRKERLWVSWKPVQWEPCISDFHTCYTIWVKFRIRNLHTVLLSICRFLKKSAQGGSTYWCIHSFISIQPLGRLWQEPEPSQGDRYGSGTLRTPSTQCTDIYLTAIGLTPGGSNTISLWA
jgi:hypothetical protein